MTPSTTLAMTQGITADPTVRRDAVQVMGETADRVVEAVLLQLDDGTCARVPASLTGALVAFMQAAADGSEISIRLIASELTTTGAAQLLGVSRPTVMKMVTRGDLAAHRVGTHTRLRRDDVLALRDRRQADRAAAADELLAAGEPFD